MTLITSNNVQTLLSEQKPSNLDVRPEPHAAQVKVGSSPEPSSIVTISDEAARRQVEELYANSATYHYIERSDKEYDQMTFEELVDEMNGEANRPEEKGENDVYITNHYTKAHMKVLERLFEQRSHAFEMANSLESSVSEFKSQVRDHYSWIESGSFDISYADGQAVVTSGHQWVTLSR